MRRRRPKIQWTAGSAPEKKSSKSPRHHPYMGQTDWGKDDHVSRSMPHLVPGTLWRTEVPLGPAPESVAWQRHEFQYLYVAGPGALFPEGTIAIYTGEVRVTEMMRTGQTILVQRHCFLLGGIRYITKSMQDFMPVMP